MAVPANFTIVTLGVADLHRSAAFYRALGWEQRGDLTQGIIWFKTAASWLGLFPDADLAADIGVPDDLGMPRPRYRGITLAMNVNTDDEVDLGLSEAVAAGATLVKPGTRADFGGYTGYFADPDGHLWEIAHVSSFPVADDGTIEIT